MKKYMRTLALKKIVRQQHTYFDGANFENTSNVILYKQAHCVYNRIKKAANTSVLMFMAEALRANNGEIESAKGKAGYKYYKKQCLKHGRSLKQVWMPSQADGLQHYFWFTVVRNPYTRLLSAFLQKGALSSQVKGKFHNTPGFDDLTSAGFNEFVSFLEDGGLHVDRHWWPQHELLFFPCDRFDYIAKTETLEYDMRHILNEIGLKNIPTSSFAQPHNAEKSTEWKITNANDRIKKFYSTELFERVYKLYENDFVLFDYDPDEYQ